MAPNTPRKRLHSDDRSVESRKRKIDAKGVKYIVPEERREEYQTALNAKFLKTEKQLGTFDEGPKQHTGIDSKDAVLNRNLQQLEAQIKSLQKRKVTEKLQDKDIEKLAPLPTIGRVLPGNHTRPSRISHAVVAPPTIDKRHQDIVTRMAPNKKR